jgi:hypothetical protein
VPVEDCQRHLQGALGKSGTELPNGVYRVGLAHNDLPVTFYGVKLESTFAFSS